MRAPTCNRGERPNRLRFSRDPFAVRALRSLFGLLVRQMHVCRMSLSQCCLVCALHGCTYSPPFNLASMHSLRHTYSLICLTSRIGWAQTSPSYFFAVASVAPLLRMHLLATPNQPKLAEIRVMSKVTKPLSELHHPTRRLSAHYRCYAGAGNHGNHNRAWLHHREQQFKH